MRSGFVDVYKQYLVHGFNRNRKSQEAQSGEKKMV